ncbi:MAG: DNA repair exonuclease [Clostridia bacterium]|nr:DNA repair exonuclease [Clostridia bacterium]
MKFVHIADMHFDTSFSQINDNELGSIRRLEQRKILKKIVDYIKEKHVDYLFIAGDFYEQKFIKESTIDYINGLFREIMDTKIFITPGNHDPLIKNSFYYKYAWSPNVHIFNSKLSYVDDGNVRIYGYGFDDFYYTNSELNSFELTDKDKINILITHGTLNGTDNVERQYNAISRNELERAGFDYVALGHIHKKNYTMTEKIVYPGSPMSMGFDEPGEHGMVVGEFDGKSLSTEFVRLDEAEFKIIDLDVSNCSSLEDLSNELNMLNLNESNFYEICLVGRRRFELDLYILKKSIFVRNIIKLKDKTKLDYDLEEMSKEHTMKGLFAQEILNRLSNENYDKEIVEKALEIGLEILEK